MLAAYRGQPVDAVPVAPEFWYYIPAKLLGVDMTTFEREVPLWEALQRTFKHYRTEGWAIVGPHVPAEGVRAREEWIDLGGGRHESRVTIETADGTLTRRHLYDAAEPSWLLERPIKVFERDWPVFRATAIGNVAAADWSGVQRALDAVGEDYLLEAAVGAPFFDFIATGREGGLAQAVFDLAEHERFLDELHEEYVEYVRSLVRAAFERTTAEAAFIGCCWSCPSLIGPRLWRRWDEPMIRAAAEEAHLAGKLLHAHIHGRCREILADIAQCGVDCVCPFERPPGGDITDLSETRAALQGRVTMNGNVHTVETLIRGGPGDVVREVEAIFEQWGAPPTRLILGTGDQVGGDTPEENIAALIETGRRLGRAAAEAAWPDS